MLKGSVLHGGTLHGATMTTEAAAPPLLGIKARQILDAGKRLFMQQGFGTVSMEAIAREAGVSKATLYAHFASKQDLFGAIIRGECRRHGEALAAPDAGHDDIGAALRQFGRAFLGLLFSPAAVAVYRIVFAEAPRFPELGRIFYESAPQPTLTSVAAYLRQAVGRGDLSIPDADLAAEQFVAMLKGANDMRCFLGVAPPPPASEIARRVDSAVELFLRGYAPRR
jgi:TetR/AcrR family transcriptional regulator, mexJK operon transcriptional repressor